MNIITLTNGKKVANFSSPHEFKFEDGNVLPAASNKEAERLKINFIEEELGNGDIKLSFELPDDVLQEMDKWMEAHRQGDVDVVFCPMPMINAIKLELGESYLKKSPFRGIRMQSRIDKLVSIHKQCL